MVLIQWIAYLEQKMGCMSKCKETHWVLLISDRNAAVHFNLFGME